MDYFSRRSCETKNVRALTFKPGTLEKGAVSSRFYGIDAVVNEIDVDDLGTKIQDFI
jgi:hypothetical protein